MLPICYGADVLDAALAPNPHIILISNGFMVAGEGLEPPTPGL